jgi:Rne/Rng family ribonuclease
MSKTIIISERDNIAAVVKDKRVVEFFIQRGEVLLGDIYLSKVQNVLPSIDAAFVDVGSDKMGFIHASDLIGKGALTELVKPNQNLIVQVVKEPTGHKGPRVTTAISLPGRFLVLMPFEKGINVSKKISSPKERARLKSVVSVLKPPGLGVIIRTEAEGQTEAEIQEDLEFLLEKWQSVVTVADTVVPPNLLLRDQDLLYKVIREACTEQVNEIVVDTSFAYHRAQQLLQSWNISNINLSLHKEKDSILMAYNIDKEIKAALQTKINLPSGGYLYIQPTEALTVIDVNSGKFVSSATQEETIRKTNLEAVDEIARQLRLRNIGGMIIVDFIDMDNRADQISILEQFELALEPDKSKPQIGQISDLGLVELTRHRQGQSLAEIFTKKCNTCSGIGSLIEEFNFVTPPQEAEMAIKAQKTKQFKPIYQKPKFEKGPQNQQGNQQNAQQKFQKPEQHQNSGKALTPPAPRRIETTPALTAADRHKIVNRKHEENEAPKINKEAIQEHLKSEDYIPDMAKIIRVSSVPSEIAKENLGEDYKPDVFNILEEIEAKESHTAKVPEKITKAETVREEEAVQPVEEAEKKQEEDKAKITKTISSSRGRRTGKTNRTTRSKPSSTKK